MTDLQAVILFCAMYAGMVSAALYMTVSQKFAWKRVRGRLRD